MGGRKFRLWRHRKNTEYQTTTKGKEQAWKAEETTESMTLLGAVGQYVLSECFSQDPLENYFGQLRARGGQCENLTVKSALESAQSLKVQGSLSMQPVMGNSSRKRWLFHGQEYNNNSPLLRGEKRNDFFLNIL